MKQTLRIGSSSLRQSHQHHRLNAFGVREELLIDVARLSPGPRIAASLVVAQAPNDVFNVDHRVVNHVADGDGETAERHDVERAAELLQSNDAAEQRERDGGDGDCDGSQIEQEQRQHDDDKHPADIE